MLATPPMKIGAINLEESDLMKGWAPIAAYVPFTVLQNITGQPAISRGRRPAYRSAYNLSAASARSTCCSNLRRRSKRLSPGTGSARRSTADIPTGCGENGCMFRAMYTIHAAQAGQGGPLTIACMNKAGVDLGVPFDRLTATLQKCFDQHFLPVWGYPVKLYNTDTAKPSDWQLRLL